MLIMESMASSSCFKQGNKYSGPEYEKDKKNFDQFQVVKNCLFNIDYYEKYIRNLEQSKSRLECALSTLTQDNQAYKINKEYIQEIAAQIDLLQDLQRQNIKQLIYCRYIITSVTDKTRVFRR